MHRILSVLLILVLVPPAVGQDPAMPEISELYPDPDSGREFIELHNPTSVTLDLTGWRIEDAAGNGYTFARSLAPGAYVVVWSGGSGDALGPAMSGSTVWNNAGDTAFLSGPDGALVDSVRYGTPEMPAPPKGQSIHRASTGWATGVPSPGGAPGQQVGTATATVEDVPPEAEFVSVPSRLRPGEAGLVVIEVTEANGDAATWELSQGVTVLHAGEAGRHELVVSFSEPGDIVLTLHAEDAAGNTVEKTAALTVAEDTLRVVLPANGIRFPSLPPGGGPVDADEPFQIWNDGSTTQAPRLDLSDLRGPGTIPVAGHALIGTRPDADTEWTWTPYDAPLVRLPDQAPGSSVEVLLRILDIPSPLPAGAYHTSFTVVP